MLLFLALLVPTLLPDRAKAQQTGIEVDLELVLMVDVSRSMSPQELELQRRGYAEALASDEVFKALQGGLLQSMALTYVEWAGQQEVILDWRLIETRADLDLFARDLTASYDTAMRRTSISGALAFGAKRIESNVFSGLRRVIDISGDGPNNLGLLVREVRAEVLSKGITINGLPLMTDDEDSGFGQMFYLPRLDLYYENCVIGGPGAFVIPVTSWPDFAAAVRRKLVLEIAGRRPDARLIQAQARDPRDCEVGEKIWLDWMSRREFFMP
ncbi:MAG: DUF1194 domain-containing protein [Sulfitobacter sp.]|nr:DUF1194 domain-containing protein [Sulfitobacter sp.]